MAFNALHTFQRNRRFWMAAILMICMVSFVFCTGMRGDMQDKLVAWFGSKGGSAVVSIDGRGVSDRDLEDLRMQRNLANSFMKICADVAHKKLVKQFYDVSKKQVADKDLQARDQELGQLDQMKRAIDERRAKPRYFDIGVKFDDLIEFKLWQAEADRLGIRLEPQHVDFLFKTEFFFHAILSDQDISFAQQQAKRDNHRDASNAVIRGAIGEEFRVKIAQYVVLGAQPYSFLHRKKREEGYTFKFSDPAMPDETRALVTLAHLYEYYKAKRSEFEVTMIPVNIEDFVSKIKDEVPKGDERTFFNAHKDKPNDPASDTWGLEIPTRIKVEFIYADTKSPYYLGKAKLVAALKATNSLAFDTGFGAAGSALAIDHKHKTDLQAHYDAMVSKEKISPDDRYRGAALNSERNVVGPVMAFMAGQHPDLVTSLIGAAAMTPVGGLTSFLAEGDARHAGEVEAALHSEMIRRTPVYRDVLKWAFTGTPLTLVGPLLSIDPALTNVIAPEMEPIAAQMGIKRVTNRYIHPLYTVETVQSTIQQMIDERTAEEWAQEKMLALRGELEKAKGDAAKYRRVLNSKEVRDMHLTYGPAEGKKKDYYDRFSIQDAKEFEVLHEAYLKYVTLINMSEGRDVSLGGILKPSDYPKMFFDGTESFSVASSLYGAMPWPPDVKPSTVRDARLANPRLIDPNNLIEADRLRFENHIAATDPNLLPPKLELFKTAARPILFWRSAEILAQRPNDYDKIGRDIKDFGRERAKVEEELKKTPRDTTLVGKKAEFERKEKDLENILKRITKGLEFERARSKVALPEAKQVALNLLASSEKIDAWYRSNEAVRLESADRERIKREKIEAAVRGEAETLSKIINEGTPAKAEKAKLPLISLPKLSDLQQYDYAGRGKEYFPPQLPKDEGIKYPRDDMMKQILSLYDLTNELKTSIPDPDDASKVKPVDPALDAINKALFDKVRQEYEENKAALAKVVARLVDEPADAKLQTKKAELETAVAKSDPKGKFVQILTNLPRSNYYVAIVTVPPKMDERQFAEAMKGARFPEDFNPKHMAKRDHFAEKAQEEAAQVYRAQVVESLRILHNVGTVDADVKKKFDGRGAGD